MNVTSNEFRIDIIFGGKAIFVKCPGYDSEVFIPQIINNRIAFQNAVIDETNYQINPSDALNPLGSKNENRGRLKENCQPTIRQKPPIANSTPVRRSQLSNQSPMQQFPTPDIVRRAVIQNKNDFVSMPRFAPGVKIVPLHRAPTQNTPNKLAKVAPFTRTHTPLSRATSQRQILRNLSNVSSFGTPPSLNITPDLIASMSPNQSFLQRRIPTPGSSTKWRKCITPQRTYIRRSNGQKTPLKLNRLSVKPIQLGRSGKLIPNFLINPTKCPTVDGKLLYRRKLKIDTNLKITPRTFKKQLKHTEDLKRNDFQLPKSRRQLLEWHQTAFDLLTNSSYVTRISKKLNTVFRKGCVNKRADTILKYQQLTASIPSIET